MTSPEPSDEGGGILDTIGGAVAGATTSLIAPVIAPLINAIQVWMNGIQAGIAHGVNVFINNAWFGFLALAGGALMVVGLLVLWGATPKAGAIGTVVKLAGSMV